MQDRRTWFAKAFDLPQVLDVWGAGLPPEQVHVVTVPRRGVQQRRSDVLWQRFAEAFGIDPAWAPVDSERSNRSLGMAETQLLRRLNRGVEREARNQGQYDDLIRDLLMDDQLGGRESGLVRMPPSLYPWAEEQTERWVEWIERSGVHVVGDLAELRPLPPPEGTVWVDPDEVSAKQQLGAAVDGPGGDDARGGPSARPGPGVRQQGEARRAEAARLMTVISTSAAWTWVDHLRAGGSTPWAAWLDARADVDDPRRGDRLLPGAQQLELLRRLNEAGTPSPDLVERVLVASAPGRGRQDLELVGAVEPLAFGPRPIDPATLTDDDLVRVAVGLIAEDVVAAGVPSPEPVKARRWRTRYRLAGDPWLADPMRAELVAQGRPTGGRGAVVAVVGTDLATLLAHDWMTRCFTDGSVPWDEFCATLARRGRVPRRVDLASSAARWAERQGGPDLVRLVLDPRKVAKVVGVRRLAVAPDVSADAAELARRVAGALGLLVTPAASCRAPAHRPATTAARRCPGRLPSYPWPSGSGSRSRPARIQRRLRAGGYPVVGDLDATAAALAGPPGPAPAAGPRC